MDSATRAYLDREKARTKAEIDSIFAEGSKREKGIYNWDTIREDYNTGALKDSDIYNFNNAEKAKMAEAVSVKPTAQPVKKEDPSIAADVGKSLVTGIGKIGTGGLKFGTEVLEGTLNLLNPFQQPAELKYPEVRAQLAKKYPQYINNLENSYQNKVAKAVQGAIGETPQPAPMASMVTGKPEKTKGTGLVGNIYEGIQTVEDSLYKPKTGAGEAVEGLSTFVGGLYGLYKAGYKGVFSTAKGNVAGSAVVGGTIMNPDDPRLLNMIADLHPQLRNTFLEGLLVDPNDPAWMNRARGAFEEAGLATAAEGLIKATKFTYHLIKGDRKAAEKIAENVDKVVKEDAANVAETPIQKTISEQTGAPSAAPVTGSAREQAQKAAQQKVDTQSRIAQAFREGKITKRSELDGYIEAGDPVRGVQSWREVQAATRQIEEYVGHAVRTTADVPFELQLQVAKSKPAFMRSAEDLVTLAEEQRGLPEVNLEVPTNVGTGQVLTDAERASAMRVAEPIPNADEVSRRLVAAKQVAEEEAANVNKIIIKVENAGKGKSAIKPAERQRLITTFVDQVDRLNQTAKKSDFPSLYMNGTLNPDRTINFAQLAANRGHTQTELIDFLKNVTIGGTKQEIAASVGGALIALSGAANAEDGSGDWSLADKLLTAALFALAGRHAYKLMAKGTKILSKEAVSEAEAPFVKSYTEEASKLPHNISPMVTPIKALPRVRPEDLTSATEKLAAGDHKGAAQIIEDTGFNLDHIDSDQDVQDVIAQFSDMFSSQANKAAGGVQTNEQTIALANELGTSMDDLMQLYKNDTAGLAAKVTSNRVLLAASSKRVADLADVALNAGFDARPAALVSLRKQVLIHANIQNAMKGVQTEIGRALQAFRIKAYGDDLVVNKLDELLDGMGGRQLNETFAKEISDVFKHDPAAANRFVRNAATATKADMVKSAWYASVLSGVSTHVTNMVSNLVKVVEGGFEHAMAIRLGKAIGTKGAEHYQASDMVTGMMLGNRIALGLAGREYEEFSVSTVKKAFLENMPVLDAANSMKVEGQVANPMQFAVSSSAQGVKADSTYGRILDMAGKYVLSVPQRALVAEDEFFKSVNYYGNLYMEAAARGRSKGLAGEELHKYVGDMMISPDGDLMEQAMRVAREGTFTQNLGDVGQSVQKVLNKVPGSFLVMPFLRVSSNILKSAAERLPLFDRLPYIGKIADNNRVMWEAGGMQRNLVMAKYATGAVYLTTGYELVSSGHLTGGQIFEARKDAENLAGVQPYSIKLGDTYFSYNRMAPYGWYLAFIADWHNYGTSMTAQEQRNYVEAGMTIMTKFLESQTFLRGVSNIMSAIHESSQPNSNGGQFGRYMGNTLGSFYPSLFASANKAYVDDEVKEFWEWSDPIKARISGMSDEVYGKRNLFGQVQHYEGGVGVDIASPVMTRTENISPAAQEIYRLNVDIQRPAKRIGNVDLTAKQYDDYTKLFGEVRLGGQTLEEALNSRIGKEDWQGLSERQGDYGGRKEQIIRNTYARYSHQVKRQFMKQYPELSQMIMQDKQNKHRAQAGLPVFDLIKQSPYEDADE